MLQIKTENNITNFVKIIDNSFKMAERLVADELEKDFQPFLEEYERAGGNIKLMELSKVEKKIGKHMNLYIFDSEGVIRKSNVDDAIGVDFSHKKTFFPRITKIRKGNKFQYDRLAADLNSGEVRFWGFMPTPDHKYLLQIGTSYDMAKYVTQDMDIRKLSNLLLALNPMILNARLFDENGFLMDDPDYRADKETLAAVELARNKGSYIIEDKLQGTQIKYIHVNLDGDGKFPTDPSKVMEITYNKKIIENELMNAVLLNIIISGGFILLVIIIIVVIANHITKPIQKLKEAVMNFSAKNFDTRAPITSDDEIGELSKSFNHMAGIIQEYHENLRKLNIAYERFVPVEFLKSLKKTSIIDVSLGDQIQKDMSVLFADIRNFTSISESMTPKQIFKYLNSYLNKVGPIIRNNNGFIDKYIGDGIMALFPEKVDYAVNAAIEMQKAINTYNKEQENKGYPEVKIGIGIHLGTLMLGTIGEEKRMEGTVIADAVNLASRLEGQTKLYNVSIIISKSIFDRLESYEKYDFRFLGYATVKGKTQSVSIFEIFNADYPKLKKIKKDNKASFERAVQLFVKGKYKDAKANFNKIWKTSKIDKTIEVFIKKCDEKINKK